MDGRGLKSSRPNAESDEHEAGASWTDVAQFRFVSYKQESILSSPASEQKRFSASGTLQRNRVVLGSAGRYPRRRRRGNGQCHPPTSVSKPSAPSPPPNISSTASTSSRHT